ncbi:hypothetical protein QBC44DRAFT_333573 [Cladorrhinum sp. PSN332]|nr:hypothetical protein QBC44DRAFT_333573 [Cladorrhinum sp. PSN332]
MFQPTFIPFDTMPTSFLLTQGYDTQLYCGMKQPQQHHIYCQCPTCQVEFLTCNNLSFNFSPFTMSLNKSQQQQTVGPSCSTSSPPALPSQRQILLPLPQPHSQQIQGYPAAAAPATVSPPPVSRVPTRAQLQHYQSVMKDAKGRSRLPPTVMQALDIARESPEGASDKVVSEILEEAIQMVWDKVLDLYEESKEKEVYLMSEEEYMLFNYWQYRFVDNDIAVKVRARFWSAK